MFGLTGRCDVFIKYFEEGGVSGSGIFFSLFSTFCNIKFYASSLKDDSKRIITFLNFAVSAYLA